MAPDSEPTAPRAALPMRLTRLRVKNFRSIADIDIPLSPLTVLVGPNGSGKSNVVDALRFVRDVFARGLDQAVMDREGMGVLQRWGTEGEGITIGVTVEFAEVRVQHYNGVIIGSQIPSTVEYFFTVDELFDKSAALRSEHVRINVGNTHALTVQAKKEYYAMVFGEEKKSNTHEYIDENYIDENSKEQGPRSLFKVAEFFLVTDKKWRVNIISGKGANQWAKIESSVLQTEKLFGNLLFYALNPTSFRQPQQLLKETPFDEKGRNLAAVLRRLSRSGGANWDGLLFALRRAVASFENIEIEAVGGYLATKLIYQTDDSPPRASYLGQESDGTIRMLGLLAALQQEPAQPFISIEEPEANIHPGALAVLAGVLDEASLRSQILVTTHSPDMLDHLPAESFLIVEKVGDTTHVGPLEASQLTSVRKRLFTPGELLRMEGLQRQAEAESAS